MHNYLLPFMTKHVHMHLALLELLFNNRFHLTVEWLHPLFASISTIALFRVVMHQSYLMNRLPPRARGVQCLIRVLQEVGGPSWTVKLGRRDSTNASRSLAESDLPSFISGLDQLIPNFARKGLNARDMVALSGSHTIGQAQCFTFRNRIYDNGSNIDAGFASTLRRGCPASTSSGNSNLAPLELSIEEHPAKRSVENNSDDKAGGDRTSPGAGEDHTRDVKRQRKLKELGPCCIMSMERRLQEMQQQTPELYMFTRYALNGVFSRDIGWQQY
ncbi:hypothetical protein ACSBR2_039282 [Camellia fascicularis]